LVLEGLAHEVGDLGAAVDRRSPDRELGEEIRLVGGLAPHRVEIGIEVAVERREIEVGGDVELGARVPDVAPQARTGTITGSVSLPVSAATTSRSASPARSTYSAARSV